MSLYPFVLEMKKLLGQVDHWLTKAVTHAEVKKFDPNNYLAQRIAPDMFPLMRQIQAVSDQAKFAASRVTGKDAPSWPDTETTIDELRKRVATTISYLDSFSKDDFAGAEDRQIKLPR